MLTNEQAYERLKEFNDIVEIKKARLARVESLPADLRDIGYSFLDRDSEGNTIRVLSPETHEQKFFSRQRRVSDLNPDDRRTLFAIFFPKLVPYVERAWNDLGRYPYTIFDTFTYGSFRPCRAPNDPAMMARQRARFIAELVWLTAKYDQSIQWWATWCAYQPELPIRPVLAAAIDSGDEEGEQVYRILEASARGEHGIGRMGQHVPGVLLKSGRREGWELMAKLLKGAGREEGLRQAILESVDLGHPDAFRLFLRLIIEDDLSRFSSVVRALDVWCGLMWDSQAQAVVQRDLALLDTYLHDSDAIRESLANADDANAVFLALWSAAFDDSNVALEFAKPLLKHSDEAVRFAVVVFLCRLGHVGAAEPIYNLLSDPCPLVAVHAGNYLHDRLFIVGDRIESLFRRYESLLDRAPDQDEELASLVWPWTWQRWSKQLILEWIAEFTERVPLEWILPHYPAMRADARYGVAKGLKPEKLDLSDAETRRFVMNMVGDVSVPVCDKGHELLRKVELTADEVQSLEAYLRRKSSDFRKPVLDLLLRLPERLALESADRLLASGKAPLRQGGFEVLAKLASRKEVSESVRTKVAEVLKEVEREGSKFKKLTGPEKAFVDQLKSVDQPPLSLRNGFGLFNPADRAPIPSVKKHEVRFVPEAAQEVIRSLDELIDENRNQSVRIREWIWESEKERRLGDVEQGFPLPDYRLSLEENRKQLPLCEIWEKWFEKRSPSVPDPNGLEFFAAEYLLRIFCGHWDGYHRKWKLMELEKFCELIGLPQIEKPRYEGAVQGVVRWLVYFSTRPEKLDVIMDLAETALATVPRDKIFSRTNAGPGLTGAHWRYSTEVTYWLDEACLLFRHNEESFSDEQVIRLWHLCRWCDQPVVADATQKEISTDRTQRALIPSELVARAYELGVATEADIYDHFLGWTRQFVEFGKTKGGLLERFTQRVPCSVAIRHPWITDYVDQCRERVMEIELARGDTATPATEVAGCIRSFPGIGWFVRILKALDTTPTRRGWESNRREVLSTLLGRTYQTQEDSEADLRKAMKSAGFTEKRLIETAMFAPQWAELTEAALKRPGFADAVWWFHAHTKEPEWRVDEAVRDDWAQSIQERTPLTSDELIDGAVDVDWFQSVYSRLKKKRWEELQKVAKLASSGAGHARAVLFAKAMSKGIKKGEIVKRIEEKRNKDYVRALGLLPLAGGKARKGDLLRRYKILQEFLRTSKQFGAQRRESEKKAVEIGMANLARTAGYRDPLRLQWSMEREALADLAKGPVSVTEGETTVTLSIDERCEPAVSVLKGEKSLKSVPAKLKKNKRIKELTSRKTELRRQASRMRRALEEMMVRGDAIEGHELPELFDNPLLAPMLEKLVFVGDGILGYPDDGGHTLVDFAGTKEPIKKDESLRLAHAHDLYKTRKWARWQHDGFARERIQPFKQILRELYPITAAEKKEKTQSSRYAGHQVNPSQAMALLGGRGWLNVPEEGVRKTFHDLGISVYLEFDMNFYTPAEVEGLTVETVRFTKRGEWKSLPLTKVPPVVFSEVMRDLDLVVSVAHRGGVDPEASASTVEMRASLLKETLKLVGVKNVKVRGNFAIIDGNLREYSVHLGSAIVRGMPGQMLYVVPVHAAHRGRLFLPFADDDPKTAEVISKVLLFAEDDKIKDPAILEQL